MTYSIFFSIEAIGRDVSSDNPESCSDAGTIHDLFIALKVDGDFFGLIDSNNVCLQIMYEENKDRFLIEIPRPDLGGSYRSFYFIDDAAKILQTLPETLPPQGFEEFEFSTW